ncbi:MAG TPA: recombination mediator RecR [Candidatus Hydrogenedentes bacterium]|nr:recombination mediator RecR [Candidatus Hydrogenedentota bacterium]
MLFNTPAFEQLVDALRRLPGVGKRSAERLALHLLSAPGEEAQSLSEAIVEARRLITRCSQCCNLTDRDPCAICAHPGRDHGVICVVEQPSGAMAIEKAGAYKGLYHVLHGALSPLEGIGPDELAIDALLRRISGTVREIIVATNATAEGEATALYLSRVIGQQFGTAVTRIAHGVPMGSGLEYADDATLAHALEGRKQL